MDLKQLRYFMAIAEEGQITSAARKLHIAQPPLSQQLKAMETELGVQLFEREGRGVQLTEEGKALYRHAVKIISSMEEAQEEIRAIRNGWSGKLTIGINTLSDERLPRILMAFRQKHPQFTFKIQQNESAQLCQLLKERTIDLAIVRMPVPLDDFTVYDVKSEPYYFVTSQSHQEECSPVPFNRIQDYPLIIPSTEGLGLYNMIQEEFAQRGLQPNIICESSDISTLIQLVSVGCGATIIPGAVLKLHQHIPVHCLEIEGNLPSALSGLIGLRNGWVSKASQLFIDAYRGEP
ncbi:LysR family transcriptional regulator [Paenibacillus radicis (ex Xue et al. 2023)]|uniref:LysR family transcriptional regulator n=1 Tax=Paenibacillus radicis (ex Xue et al. 2023) TaxID=2972489 RepID=A0ABT1YP05_9BACL|nr:LysR family transcriptional regulator [Paenibacillus radicis (ex Xue et al. 2023)]MCR8634767.1 LysR family transcriptional regulator [Paenibacillus radicis (ex Xue et al. 2023)]